MGEFARRMRLQYMFYGHEEKTAHPFYTNSDYEPDEIQSPLLEKYIYETTKNIEAMSFDSHYKHNCTKNETRALRALKTNDNIIIKPADKGGSITIMNTWDYEQEAMRQLNDTNNYIAIDTPLTEDTNTKVLKIIEDMFDREEIDETTYNFLADDSNLRTPQFYMLPKIHKHDNPGRPILSGNGGPTERISKYLDYYLRPISQTVDSYIKDTGDFLNHIENMDKLPHDCLLVSMDVRSLYTNIPHHEAITAILESLTNANTSEYEIDLPHPRRFVQLLTLILKDNTFSFGEYVHRKQINGCAMGSTVSPSLAIIFMDKLERNLLSTAPNQLLPDVYYRYIDDIYLTWSHGRQSLDDFVNHFNSAHATIKFDATVSSNEVSFLDTTIYKGDNFTTTGKLSATIYHKPTDVHPLLHSTSNHPPHTRNNIAYSQALRYRKICSTDLEYRTKTEELVEILDRRGYSPRVTRKQMDRTLSKNRKDLLTSRTKDKNKGTRRPVFVTMYHPHTHKIRQLLLQRWNIIQSNPLLHSVFTEPPMVAYKRGKNLKDILTSSTFHK